MRRAAALVLASLLLAGCGEEDRAKPVAQKPKPAATPEGCAEAKKKIADLPKPEDNEGVADFADQAADALGNAGANDAVPILRDIELLSVEMKFKRLQKTGRQLADAGGECGEKEALAGIAPSTYSFGWQDTLTADRRYTKRLPRDVSLAEAMRQDAGRMRRMAARIALIERYGKISAEVAASGNAEARDPEVDRVGARRDAAAKRLDRALQRLFPS